MSLAMEPSSAEESFVFPMSFAQQRLWLLDQREGGSAFYNIPAALRLRGPLDIDALARALNEIVARHESLRTNFASEDDLPVQVIRSAAQLSVPVVALADDDLLRLIEQTIAAPFDLAHDLLVRARLIRLGVEEHVLVLAVHHIVADGWSVGVFVRELSALYAAFIAGQPSPLAELPIQYADFSEWQREWLQGKVLAEQLDYWRRQLSGAPELTTFPADRRRPAVLTYRGASQRFFVPAETLAGVKEVARNADASLFMVLLAALAIELARYTGGDDVVIGSPIANRNREEIAELIGFFVNTLVLRVDLKGNPSVRTLLDRVRQMALAAYAHQDLPFERLIEEIQPARSLSFAPFFQVMLTLHGNAGAPLAIPGLEIEPVAFDRAATLYDLTLSLEETDSGLAAQIEYNTDLFDAATIDGIARHYRALLDAIIAYPDCPIARLPLLDSEQRARQLVEFGSGRRGERDVPVHRCFEAQAARTPDAVALSCGARLFTYAALNGWANRIARALIARGVGPGAFVGILIERSPEAVAAILATLKSGGAYVPLDPAYPEERLKAMLADAGLAHLVTRRALLDRLPVGGLKPLLIDEINDAATANPACVIPFDAPAYVIFTSGSTGRPKLAAAQHRGLATLVGWFCREFGLGAGDGNLLLTSLSFDLTQKNIFASLATGGRIELYPDEEYDPDRIATIVAARRITWINCTPSMFYPLVAQDEPARFAALTTLRLVFLGGESIATGQFARWRQSGLAGAEIVNTYGPTECADVTVFHRLGAAESDRDGSLPIGGPVDKARLYILDGGLELLPQGALGELCIAGPSVGLGYLNDASATADKFRPDPYAGEPGSRLYRTGDLVRYRRDGAILFVGRIDHQVKIRGHRVEPGETEAMLAAHPEVADAAVVARGDEGGETRLIAYYAGVADRSDLAAYLRSRLPNYLVPATIIRLDALPLTPSGKVDRRALPASDAAPPPAAPAAPRTESERVLAAIWQEVLMRPAIGIHDNFFELGGHSLLATQVVSRLRRTFHIDMPMRVLFEAPTIAEFAARVDQAQLAEADRDAIEAALRDIEGRQVAE